MREFFYPRGGWSRAAYYVSHRLRRLPDDPRRIARGIFAGVFVTFTPFYGFHFLTAALVARVVNGNILAALLGTFFGNPLTYVPIGVVSLKTGHFLLGTEFDETVHRSLFGKVYAALSDVKENLLALFTGAPADWSSLAVYYGEVFLPYLVGGICPGILTGLIAYYLSVPVITAYQNRRKGRLKTKLAALRKKAPRRRP
ncbi:hypothetical protein C8N32_10378 [Rhodovulum imhoffii]|uniref:DUF2062 domain-containing protein n=1 Tax=Rhodovulum imhoffii TaxID=365340 RepID=A0A2T5BUN4_9RHOB|nr:hypothetical protein C8N32_10378 [Rhodovulum imhoffii]